MSAANPFQNAPGPPRVQVAGPSDWVVSAANPASIRARTPPPAPDPDEPPLTGAMAPPSILPPASSAPSLGYHDTNVGQQRAVFTYGSGGEIVLFGIERAPDWDLDDPPIELRLDQVPVVMRVIQALGIRIKNWTMFRAEASVGRPHPARATGDDAPRRTRGRPPGSGKRQRAAQAGEPASGAGREWLAAAGSTDRPDGGDHLIEGMDRPEAESG
jgi:hypothetical protein